MKKFVFTISLLAILITIKNSLFITIDYFPEVMKIKIQILFFIVSIVFLIQNTASFAQPFDSTNDREKGYMFGSENECRSVFKTLSQICLSG